MPTHQTLKAAELIQFLEKSIYDEALVLFLETHNFSTKKFPKKERRKSLSTRSANVTSKLHGVELRLGFDGLEIILTEIVFFKPQSDGLQAVHEIEYPFGLYLNQKIDEYSTLLGETVGFIEPHYHSYILKNYAVSIFFDPDDQYKRTKKIEISLKNSLT